jgi:hypothetical protein
LRSSHAFRARARRNNFTGTLVDDGIDGVGVERRETRVLAQTFCGWHTAVVAEIHTRHRTFRRDLAHNAASFV